MATFYVFTLRTPQRELTSVTEGSGGLPAVRAWLVGQRVSGSSGMLLVQGALGALGGLIIGLLFANRLPHQVRRLGISDKMPFAQSLQHNNVVYVRQSVLNPRLSSAC
jgi:hypothetical protein